MQIEEQTIPLQGHRLHRLILRPDGESRGGMIFFHGQGDFIGRYPPLLSAFVDQGISCVMTDFPGHGRSSGQRGHISGLDFVDELIDLSLEEIKGPLTVSGHSMGGLMALRCLLNRSSTFQSAWFSSPLLAPMRQAKPWMRATLPLLSHILPWVSVSTGVKAADCRDANEPSDQPAEKLHHSRVSLGWGRALKLTADEVATQFLNLPKQIPILFTQGSEDNICPPAILKARLEKLAHGNIDYREIEGARHEPFTGSTEGFFQKTLRDWVKRKQLP